MNSRTQRLLQAQAETARMIVRLMLTLLGLGLVGVLTLGFPDSYLLTTKTTVSVPFAGAASFKALLLLGPFVLIAVRIYLQIYLEHWKRLDKLTRRFNAVRVPLVSPLRHPLLRVFSSFAVYPLVPLVLGVFTWEAMAFQAWGVWLLYLTITSITVLLSLAFPWSWSFKLLPVPLAILGIFISVQFLGGFDGFRRPFRLQLADLERSILTDQDLRNADLRNSNLHDAVLEGTKLHRADLGGADLSGAVLAVADLSGANLGGADLSGAVLTGAVLSGAVLAVADLSGAVLMNARFCRTTMPEGTINNADCE